MYQIALSVADKLNEVKDFLVSYKEYLENVDWTQVATVVISGVGIVLGVLIVFIGVFSGFGALVPKIEAAGAKSAKKKSAKKSAKKAAKAGTQDADQQAEAAVTAAPVVVQAKKEIPQPFVEQGISGEVVAAITAAVVASEGTGNVVIRSVKRKDVGSRNPWAGAAVIENTRSF